MKGKYIARSLIAFVAVVVIFAGVFVALLELMPFDTSKLELNSRPTVVYDRDGHRIATINAPGSNDVSYQDIPKNLQNAVVATEDHNFWKSGSIDVKGLLRAAFVDLWSGSMAQGGSTIEEQLAKIVYLTDKKTFSRKFQQIVLGVQIDRHFTKQEILAMYLNRAYFGEGATGIREAAIRYFGVDLAKHPNELTLNEAATLAGLLQAPSAYDPILHMDAAVKRRNQVLENMAKYGYISEATAKQVEAQKIPASFHNLPGDIWDQNPMLAKFLFDYADKNGIDKDLLSQGGLKVYTTVDPQVQSALNQVFYESANYNNHFEPAVNGQPVPAAAVFVDPKTGGILGVATGHGKNSIYSYDRVYEYGQPGSSIKPVLDYAPAIEEGKITPNTVLDNQPHDFGNGFYPQNDEPMPARVTVRWALAHSANVAACTVLQMIGIDNGIEFAENMGLQFTKTDHTHLGIAIGGMQKGVTPLQMAQAYTAFDNDGVEEQAHLITRIVNQSGDEIYDFAPAAKRVMSTQTAQVMTDLMTDVVAYGTGTGARLPGWGVAGKTGTVQYDTSLNGSHKDWVRLAWFDGYTPNMVGSIYMGWNYDGQGPEYHMLSVDQPSYMCSEIFGDVIRLAEQGRAPEQFHLSQTSSQTQTQTDAQTQTKTAVKGLHASWDANRGSVELAWQSDLTGQVNFVITRQGGGSPSPAQIGETASLNFYDANVSAGQTYTYTVQAVDPTSGSKVGAPASLTVKVEAPANPDNSVGNGAGQGNSTPPVTPGAPNNGTNNITGNTPANNGTTNTAPPTNATGNQTVPTGPAGTGNTEGGGGATGGSSPQVKGGTAGQSEKNSPGHSASGNTSAGANETTSTTNSAQG
ncbi:MAG: transglycosylase domain-containing protein [Alicyclobacillus herbarius]|uniref:transglycosylase domain-containing protein n=1 Tax=Alicyclobacillus herbarius TaxID=122960 RepID=UPI0023521FFE|nr:transglycosylase domain-containing protein [Alicyclobacillus herbarius]MCL6631145.1 transglycosylase domain-containing protein [Alicyclobacillus herbarius]